MTISRVDQPDNADYRDGARDALREMFPCGGTISTLCVDISRDGSAASIAVLCPFEGRVKNASYLAARVLGLPYDTRGGVRVSATPHDTYVYTGLTRALWGSDYALFHHRL